MILINFPISVNGSWGEWAAWTACTKPCGDGGEQRRVRQCDSPEPQYGGEDCLGEAEDTQECNTDSYCGKFKWNESGGRPVVRRNKTEI